MDKDEFTITVRFRVSGQGKRLFGDGFALWVSQDAYHKDGPLHGYVDKFTGFGIIFDTFVNTDPGHVHKDISLVVNDGQQAKAAPHGGVNDPQASGCDADFRYFEGRDDFNAAQARSAARIHYDGKLKAVTVEVDAKNTGEWIKCIEQVPVSLPDGWHSSAHIGLTATTGDLADNHDVVSLQVIEGNGVAKDPSAVDDAPAMISTGQPRFDNAARSAAASEASKVKAEMMELHHELEHHMDRIYDGLQNTIKKLNEAEKKVEARVAELEARVTAKVAATVDKELSTKVDAKIGEHVGSSVQRRIDDAVTSAKQGMDASLNSAKDLGDRMQRQMDDLRTLANSASGSDWSTGAWVGASALGLVVLAAVAYGIVVCVSGGGSGAARRRSILPSFSGGSKDHFL
jgi:mannose-binding lectin 2